VLGRVYNVVDLTHILIQQICLVVYRNFSTIYGLGRVYNVVESTLTHTKNIPLSLLNIYNLKGLGAWSSLQRRRIDILMYKEYSSKFVELLQFEGAGCLIKSTTS
jgi:hypothetical protein